MRLRTKLLVIFAFSARLPLVAIASTRLYYLHQRIDGDTYTFEYLVATQYQMGYAIMSSTITGMGPFLKPFDKEYTTTTSYKHYTSHPSTHPSSTLASSVLPPRRTSSGGLSESYLMDTLPSRRGSKSITTLPDGRRSSSGAERSRSRNSQDPIVLTADENFRPQHMYRGHEAEVWVGDRSLSIGRDDEIYQAHDKNDNGNGPRLVIGKKKEFKVEVDRVS
jgi:hypothetical protein